MAAKYLSHREAGEAVGAIKRLGEEAFAAKVVAAEKRGITPDEFAEQLEDDAHREGVKTNGQTALL